MKKRVLSLFMALALCLSMQSTTTFAENAGTVTEQEELSTTGDAVSGNDVSGGDAGDANADVQDAVQAVQALIDALPDEVTAENMDEVEALLGAIDEAMAKLTDEQAAGLDMTRWENICNAMNAPALVAVQAGEHTHYFCGGSSCNGKGHSCAKENNITFSAWEEDNSLPKTAGNYYLTKNVTLKTSWEPANDTVLCLNGYNITMEAADSVIDVKRAYTFTLCDCKGNGTITHGKNSDGTTYTGTGVVGDGGKFNMYGGTIKDNATNGKGGGVYSEYGTFNMYGGTITGNSAPNGGGGVYVYRSEFNMYGGTISYNTIGKYGGGGVYVDTAGKFTMSNGSISNNEANDCSGGGVYVYDDASGSGTFTMTGGEINNNTSSQGGGVYLEKVSEGSGSAFIMEGGSITQNTATYTRGDNAGGGVYVTEGSSFKVSGDVEISGNTGNGTVNNVYLPTNYHNTVTITITNELGDKASIGVTMDVQPNEGSPLTFATVGEGCQLTDDVAAAHFISDQGYSPYRMDGENEVKMFRHELQKHPICGEEVCPHNPKHPDVIWIGVSKLSNIVEPDKYSNYYLVGDFTGEGEALSNSYNVNLCLHGYTYSGGIHFQSRNYTLCDCKGTGKITGSSTQYGIQLISGGRLDMYGGKITGNTTVGAHVENGTFNMYGGEITENYYTGADGGAGGVRVDESGTFNMSGNAKVSDNTATFNSRYDDASGGYYGAAGVYVNGGTFTMTENAEVSGNTLTDNVSGSPNNYAGGVYVRNAERSNVTVGGNVTITGNKKGSADSNVCLPKGQTIKVSGTLKENAIGVITETPINVVGEEAVIAEGTGSYSLTKADVSTFSSDAGIRADFENGEIIFRKGVHKHYICGKEGCSDSHSHGTDKKWTAISTLSEINGAGYYFLTKDVELNNTWVCLESYNNVELCLNGKTITCSKNDWAAISVAIGASLVITDCADKPESIGKITHEDGLYGCGIYVAGSLTLWNGSITGNTHLQQGSVQVTGGTFTMNGGSITGNTTNGGVQVAGGKFYMNGGEITLNTDGYGGVYVNGGEFTMSGGKITQNISKHYSGGVYVKSGTFTMNEGGEITGNTGKNGGGVYVGQSGTFTMTGGKITKNKYTAENGGGSGVYLEYEGGTFNMDGGEITGNTNSAASGGGGVYVNHLSTFKMTNGKITGNTNSAADGGGGVYVADGSEFTMSGGEITENTNGAADGGGGVYVAGNGEFIMNSGEITGNTNSAANGGGGVYVGQFGEFTMNGGTITGNNTSATDDSSAGGVYMDGTFTVSGAAKIIDNWKGGTQAGSVYVKGTGTASNVYLHNERSRFITIGEGLTQAAQIGVSIGELPTTAGGEVQIASGATDDQLSYKEIFTLDLEASDPYYSIIRDSEYECLYIHRHKHDWKYSASGATITAKCEAADCPIKDGDGGSITIVAPKDLIYDREAKKAGFVNRLSAEVGVDEDRIAIDYAAGSVSDNTPLDPGDLPGNAGSYIASFRLFDLAKGGYSDPASVEYTIQKAEIKADDFYFNINDPKWDLVYSGADKELTEANFGFRFFDTVEITVKYYADGSAVVPAPRNVGTYTFAIDATEGKNYKAATNLMADTWTFTITKAEGRELEECKFQRRYNDRTEKTYPLIYDLPDGEKWTYSISAPTVTGSAKVGSYDIDPDTGAITYMLTDGQIKDTVSWTVTISSDNYEDFTKKLTLTLTEKDSQDPLSITGGNTVVYGETLKLGTTGGSGTGAVTYTIDESSTGEATIDADGVLTPVKVGSVFVKATKAENDDYYEISSELFEITITQAATTGEPKYAKITTDGKTLADASLTLDGSTLSPAAGTLEWVDDAGKVLSGDTEVKVNTEYTWRFTPEGGNHKTLTGKVELYHVDAPTISTQPVNASVKTGERAVFEVAATGTDLKYQWKINRNDGNGFVNISGADSASYTSGITDTDCNGFQYYCVISNAAGTVTTDTVTLTVTVEYEILDGAGSSWTENTDGSLAIRGSGAISKFLRVLVDGNEISSDNYTVTEGSTIITFKPEFLKTLPEGSHTFELVWTDGTASTNFTVAKNTSGNNGGNNNNGNNNSNNNSNNDGSSNNVGSGVNTTDTTVKAPKTGDTMSDTLWIVLLAVASVAGAAEVFAIRRKKNRK